MDDSQPKATPTNPMAAVRAPNFAYGSARTRAHLPSVRDLGVGCSDDTVRQECELGMRKRQARRQHFGGRFACRAPRLESGSVSQSSAVPSDQSRKAGLQTRQQVRLPASFSAGRVVDDAVETRCPAGTILDGPAR